MHRIYNKDGYNFSGTEWTTNTDMKTSGQPSHTFTSSRMSLCVVATGNYIATIEAEADWRADEPVYVSDGGSMRAVLTQLADGSDLAHRTVMNLTDYHIEGYEVFSDAITQICSGYDAVIGSNESTFTYDASLKIERMDDDYITILRDDLLGPVSSVAFGIQSVFTVLISRVFYEGLEYSGSILSNWSDEDSMDSGLRKVVQTLQRTERAQVPKRTKGLCIAFCHEPGATGS